MGTRRRARGSSRTQACRFPLAALCSGRLLLDKYSAAGRRSSRGDVRSNRELIHAACGRVEDGADRLRLYLRRMGVAPPQVAGRISMLRRAGPWRFWEWCGRRARSYRGRSLARESAAKTVSNIAPRGMRRKPKAFAFELRGDRGVNVRSELPPNGEAVSPPRARAGQRRARFGLRVYAGRSDLSVLASFLRCLEDRTRRQRFGLRCADGLGSCA